MFSLMLTRARVAEFFGKLIRNERGKRRKERRQEDADVPDVDGDVEEVKDVIDGGRRHHQAGINSAADDTTQRIPSAIVEPIVELVKPFLRQETSRPERVLGEKERRNLWIQLRQEERSRRRSYLHMRPIVSATEKCNDTASGFS